MRVVHRKRRLRDIGKVAFVLERQRLDIFHGADQDNAPRGQLAHRADHFGMAGMADQNHLAAALEMNLRLAMDLGDERTGCVDREQAPRQRLRRHALATPWAEKITGAEPAGASLNSSINTAPLALSDSTTYCCCTISCRT